jgi:recombination protein RecA
MARKKKDTGTSSSIDPWNVAIKGIDKKFGAGVLFHLADDISRLDVEVVPTGLVGLDDATGPFGIPRGRIIEVFGSESSAKTAVALKIVKAFQKEFPGEPNVYIDAEHALNLIWMQKNGVSLENLYISQPMNGEQATELAISLAATGKPKLIVIDSVAALTPRKELDGEMVDSQVGEMGRLMGKFMRKISAILEEQKVTLLCINQTRSSIGMPGTVRPGGKALKFYSSMVLKMERTGKLTMGDSIIGNVHRVTVQKNKIGPPYKTAILPLLTENVEPFQCGFCPELSMIETGVNAGFIKKAGAWYSIDGENIGQGSIKAAQYLAENREVYNQLYDAYRDYRLEQLKPIQFYEKACEEETEVAEEQDV